MRRPTGRGSAIPAAAALTLALAAATACRGPERPSHSGDPALDAQVRVSPTPAAVGAARVFVVAEDGGHPAVDATVRVRAQAVDPPAPPTVPELVDRWHLAEAAPGTPGGYGPVELPFPVAGAWRVEVQVTASDGRTATIRHPLAVVEGPGG